MQLLVRASSAVETNARVKKAECVLTTFLGAIASKKYSRWHSVTKKSKGSQDKIYVL